MSYVLPCLAGLASSEGSPRLDPIHLCALRISLSISDCLNNSLETLSLLSQTPPTDNTPAFLKYKEEKLKVISELESKRLEDLKDARGTIFKYALPATVIDGAAGALATLLGASILVLFPVALFIIMIYFLADALDRKKYQERLEIINNTKAELDEIRKQETGLL